MSCKTTVSVEKKHPWWHRPFEDVYSEEFSNHSANSEDENKRVKKYCCTLANCEFAKTETFTWMSK